jgi:hypothetical protein
MRNTFIQAIKSRHVVSFTYKGIVRVAEPHAVGVTNKGNDVIRCFQTAGGHVTPGHEWDLCKLSEISGLRTTGESFDGPRPGYKRGDRGMVTIYGEL